MKNMLKLEYIKNQGAIKNMKKTCNIIKKLGGGL